MTDKSHRQNKEKESRQQETESGETEMLVTCPNSWRPQGGETEEEGRRPQITSLSVKP